jgi:hypothetical protein
MSSDCPARGGASRALRSKSSSESRNHFRNRRTRKSSGDSRSPRRGWKPSWPSGRLSSATLIASTHQPASNQRLRIAMASEVTG